MAITTYAQLQTAAASWLDRTDLTALIPEFIELSEARFNRVIRSPDMIAKDTTFALASQFTTLPTDTLEIIRIVVDVSPPITLEYLTPEEISEGRGVMNTTGRPRYFTVIGGATGQLEVLPSPDDTYTSSIIYYTKIPALTDSATSNWLLASHPDIYLYGLLVEAEPYLKNDERLPVWSSQLDQALTELRLQGQRTLHSGSSLRMRARVLG